MQVYPRERLAHGRLATGEQLGSLALFMGTSLLIYFSIILLQFAIISGAENTLQALLDAGFSVTPSAFCMQLQWSGCTAADDFS